MSRKRSHQRKPGKRYPNDPIHGRRPEFNPGHPLWQDIQDRLATGVYTFPQVSVHAEKMGFPLTVFQIQVGLKRYKPAHLPMRVFPWLADMVQHILDNFVDWDAQLDAAATQQAQLVGMVMEKMRDLRERPEIINGPDGVPLKITNAHGHEEYVILPAASIDDKIHILNAAQNAVGKLFRMLVERTRLHADMRVQMPGTGGEQTAEGGQAVGPTLYTISNVELLRKEMEEVDREMRETYNMLIKEAAEVGAILPEPKPLDANLEEAE
jgi:hypothetical protein